MSPQQENPATETPRLFSVTEFCRTHTWPPAGGLRHSIFHANTNGFAAVIRQVGRRVLIDEAAFFAWVEAQNGQGAAR